jgi:pilus assembly protein CpaD
MSRITTLAAVAALGMGASACAPTNEPLSATNNPSLYSVHQPIVQRTDFVLDLQTSSGGLSDAEAARLNAWLASIGAAYGDRISVDEPDGYVDSDARADIARVAAGYGLLLSDGAPVLAHAVQPGSIRVVATRAIASVPGCPNWNDPQLEPTTNTSANFGCATNSNLAALVANPDDLVVGQETSEGGATTAGRAIRVYRDREPTGTQPLPSTTTRGGNQ